MWSFFSLFPLSSFKSEIKNVVISNIQENKLVCGPLAVVVLQHSLCCNLSLGFEISAISIKFVQPSL